MLIPILIMVLAALILIGFLLMMYACVKAASKADEVTNEYETKDETSNTNNIFYIYLDSSGYFITFRKSDNYKLIATMPSYEEAEEYIKNLSENKEDKI